MSTLCNATLMESADRDKALVKQMLLQFIAEQIYVGDMSMCLISKMFDIHQTRNKKTSEIVVVKILWFTILLLSDYPVTMELAVFFVAVLKSFTFVKLLLRRSSRSPTNRRVGGLIPGSLKSACQISTNPQLMFDASIRE